jgi:hypothetical protein
MVIGYSISPVNDNATSSGKGIRRLVSVFNYKEIERNWGGMNSNFAFVFPSLGKAIQGLSSTSSQISEGLRGPF